MSRKKIRVDNYLPNISADHKQQNDDIINVSLVISISLEFEGEIKMDLSNLLEGLSNDESVNRRKELIKFVNFINMMKGEGISKQTRVRAFVDWVKLVNRIAPNDSISSKEVISGIHSVYQKKFNDKLITMTTFNGARKQFRVILRDCFLVEEELFNKLFPQISARTGTLNGATINNNAGESKAFSKKDFRLVIALLLHYARDFKYRFDEKFDLKHLQKNQPSFEYSRGVHTLNTSQIKPDSNEIFNIRAFLINRATAYYMLVFISITGANLSPIMRAKRNEVILNKGERDLFTILITDKRKKKLKEPEPYLMKKFQERLFQEILKYSKFVDPSSEALLFPYVNDDNSLSTFRSRYITSTFQAYRKNGPVGEFGEILHPAPKKLRESHGQEFDDLITRSGALRNSTNVAAKHYSDGNPEENNDRLQQGMNAYTMSLISGEDLSEIYKNYNFDIDIKLLDVEKSEELLNDKKASKTMTGGVCKNAKNSEEAERHKRKLLKLKMLKDDELICNNILACITCPNHIFVEDEEYIYILFSFYEFLAESLYTFESGGLFGSRDLINKAMSEIAWIKQNRIGADLVIKVERKIKKDGPHPLWSYDFLE